MHSNTHGTSPSPHPLRSRRTRTATRRTRIAKRKTSCDDMSPFESWMDFCLSPVFLHFNAIEEFLHDMPPQQASRLVLALFTMWVAEAAVFGAAGLVLWGIGKCLAKLIRKTQRPKYYPQERMRRRRLAKERRSIRKRFTLNKIPTAEMLLLQWEHVRGSPRDMIVFGSMLCDLEAYVDNSLIRDEYGEIIGRHPGIRGWLCENCPQLAARYKTVMKYKAMTEKFRQVVGLSDPYPATMVIGCNENTVRKDQIEMGEKCENMVRNSQDRKDKAVDGNNENTVRNSITNERNGANGVVCDEVLRKAEEAAKVFFAEFWCDLQDDVGNETNVGEKTTDGNVKQPHKRLKVTQLRMASVLNERLNPESVPLEIEIQERRRQRLPDHDGILRKFSEMMA